MKTNQKLLWGGLGLLALIFVCCFGVLLGSALSRDKVGPTAPLALAIATRVPLPPTRPPATVVVIEPTPTLVVVHQSSVSNQGGMGIEPSTTKSLRVLFGCF